MSRPHSPTSPALCDGRAVPDSNAPLFLLQQSNEFRAPAGNVAWSLHAGQKVSHLASHKAKPRGSSRGHTGSLPPRAECGPGLEWLLGFGLLVGGRRHGSLELQQRQGLKHMQLEACDRVGTY